MTSRPLLALLLLGVASPALAADPPALPTRVDRLEKEVRAIQRKVFPGGAPAFSEPEIAAPEAIAPAGAPAGQPINELAGRISSLERELARVTNQQEQDEHRLQLLSDATARDRAEFDARLKAIEQQAPTVSMAPGGPAPDVLMVGPAKPTKGPRGRAPAPLPEPPVKATADAAPSSAAHATTGDAGEDAYMAAYQLWVDKHFDEAATALKKVAKQYPKHKRASYARNLAGRAELDGGKPATAAQTFLDNYQVEPKGERAPDSLFYLGQALTALKKNDRACTAYDELQATFGKTMGDTLKAKLPAARKAAGCTAS